METLVASVLTIVIFMVSSLILNNVFGSTMKHQTGAIENRLYELEYFAQHHKLILPHYEDFRVWNLSIEAQVKNSKPFIFFEAVNHTTKVVIHYQRYDHH